MRQIGMAPDTSRTIEIAGSLAKLVLLAILGVGMAALSYAATLTLTPGADFVTRLICYFGVAFFSLCTLVALWRLRAAGTPVVTISPQGIRVTNIAPELIPWRAVMNISTWRYQGQNVMVLAVDPATEKRLTLTRLARWTRSTNRALGADGLCVSATGLKIDYDTLLKTSVEYWQAYRHAA